MENTFLQNLLNAPEAKPIEYVDSSLNYFSREAFEDTLKNIRNLSEHDMFNFIKSNIDFIDKGILDKDPAIVSMLVDIHFLKPYDMVVRSMPITGMRKLCVNKVWYDYFTSDLNNIHVRNILFELSRFVNANEINQLKAIGLDEDTACNLASSRYSSINENINIKRVNFVICSKDPDIMTEQTIVWIYEKLFDRVGQLFTTTMLEYYVPAENDEVFMENLSTIYLSILTIVNNLPTDSIFKVLKGYIMNWEYVGKPRVRMSLRSLSADFGRIAYAVEVLMGQGQFVP